MLVKRHRKSLIKLIYLQIILSFMKIYSKEDAFINKFKISHEIKNGAVFVYPTDTVYGLGADATNSKAVDKVRKIKTRPNQPFSVFAPSKSWIRTNCDITEHENWLRKLPGKFTLIAKLIDKKCISPIVNLDKDTLGVRIPDHWMNELISFINIPIITTSVNKTGKPYMTSKQDLNPKIKKKIDFMIYEGEKDDTPSTIVRLDKEEIEIIKR
ncbi:threonylcarbamoyl-AMP synthase [Candidatus Woesearchaeota archaeon]|nr:threonylcarbamoyl-AMP synthase [Candidatus Woesearchaeota archaeon]